MESFRCERRNCTLTRSGCARLWERAQASRPKPWEGLAACFACPVGAANAGQPPDLHAGFRDLMRPICAACGGCSDRIIANRYCPSCYNRRREARVGRNGKGGVPRIAAHLFDRDLAVAVRPGTARVVRISGVLTAGEAVLAVAKGAPAPVSIGWPGMADAA